ncbi:hypothetical protein [Lactobacillus sp. PSON]|uniref:hypothetical protein n=1 Tax=Lactobacillus sp. PSON TaxID=3455454 RepID=UPI004042571F
MKKWKKYLTTIIVLIITIMGIGLSSNSNDANALKFPWGGLWKIAARYSDRFFRISPHVYNGPYGRVSTPGTVILNGSKYGSSAMYNIKARSTKNSLALYAKGSPRTLFNKYSLIVINPHGHYTINAAITTGVYRGFKFGLRGTYKVIFASNTYYELAPYVSYRKDSANRIFGTSAVAIPNTINNSNNQNDKFENVGYGSMLYPSWGTGTQGTPAKTLTVAQLYNQLDDNGTGVYSTKSYLPGSTITVSDTVTGVEYEPSTNSTELFFGSPNIYLEYQGNLTNVIKPGTHFEKAMKVEQLGNNAAYRLPDYFKYLLDNNESSYPSYY